MFHCGLHITCLDLNLPFYLLDTVSEATNACFKPEEVIEANGLDNMAVSTGLVIDLIRKRNYCRKCLYAVLDFLN